MYMPRDIGEHPVSGFCFKFVTTFTVCTFFFFNFRGERGRKRGRKRERETLLCCYTFYLCIHWLILVCALTRDQNRNHGMLGWCSNQLSWPARAYCLYFLPQFSSASLCLGFQPSLQTLFSCITLDTNTPGKVHSWLHFNWFRLEFLCTWVKKIATFSFNLIFKEWCS